MEDKKRRGRPATGRTSKTVRVPKDCDIDIAMKLYYDILPSLTHWYDQIQGKDGQPRYDRIIKLYQELGMDADMLDAGR